MPRPTGARMVLSDKHQLRCEGGYYGSGFTCRDLSRDDRPVVASYRATQCSDALDALRRCVKERHEAAERRPLR